MAFFEAVFSLVKEKSRGSLNANKQASGIGTCTFIIIGVAYIYNQTATAEIT